MFEDEYKLEFFKSHGYERHVCPVCSKPYWSLGPSENCNEVPCTEYGFIGTPIMNTKLDLHDMREFIIAYFERNGHTRISRYPIVARWRDDVFYTQASIYDFQPRVTAGEDDPPANPLIISQPCVRFNDIENVGRTGRHLTLFEMIGHHVFNSPTKYVYWKEQAVAYCHNFLTREVGIPEEFVIYKEKPWFGGGNAGPSLEVICKGLELCTLVFMNLKQTPDGNILLDDNNRYTHMTMQVVDPGWGLDRFVWMSQASPSVYEAIFGPVLEDLKTELKISPDEEILSEYSRVAGMMNFETLTDVKLLRNRVAEKLKISVEKLEKEIIPMENLYRICDHSRALMFILNDGVVPSNVKEGYYARLLIRRAIPAMKMLNLKMPLRNIVENQIEYFKKDFPEVEDNRDDILKLIDWEENSYNDVLKEGKNIINRVETRLKTDGKEWEFDELRELYDSHGLRPDMVQQFASIKVNIPEDFDKRLAKYHEEMDGTKDKDNTKETFQIPEGIPATELAFYTEEWTKFFTATIYNVGNGFLILDKTYFYPEGGGEESDTGSIDDVKVTGVKRIGNVVVHIIDKNAHDFKVGDQVHCEIDWDRRKQLIAHHTGAHIINGVAREILGNHVWQAGAHKGADSGRLDITHYKALTQEEIDKIEKRANEIVHQNLRVKKEFMERSVAERKYGFRLYQGGAVPGKKIRIVNINDWDVEACGGTHADWTTEVGKILITSTKRIQQGVVRIEFVAGFAAGKYKISEYRKQLSNKTEKDKSVHLTAEEIDKNVADLLEKAQVVGDVRVVSKITSCSVSEAIDMTKALTRKGNLVSVIGANLEEKSMLIIARSGEPTLDKIDASEILRKVLPIINGTGGGKKDFAQGGGNKTDGLSEAVKTAVEEITKNIQN